MSDYLAIIRKLTGGGACKVHFSTTDYVPDAINMMVRSSGAISTADLQEFQLMKLLANNEYQLVAEKPISNAGLLGHTRGTLKDGEIVCGVSCETAEEVEYTPYPIDKA